MVDLVVVGGLCATPQAPGEELQLVLLEAVREGVVDVELGLEGDVGGLDDGAEALVDALHADAAVPAVDEGEDGDLVVVAGDPLRNNHLLWRVAVNPSDGTRH